VYSLYVKTIVNGQENPTREHRFNQYINKNTSEEGIYKNNQTNATSGAETAYSSGAPMISTGF